MVGLLVGYLVVRLVVGFVHVLCSCCFFVPFGYNGVCTARLLYETNKNETDIRGIPSGVQQHIFHTPGIPEGVYIAELYNMITTEQRDEKCIHNIQISPSHSRSRSRHVVNRFVFVRSLLLCVCFFSSLLLLIFFCRFAFCSCFRSFVRFCFVCRRAPGQNSATDCPGPDAFLG